MALVAINTPAPYCGRYFFKQRETSMKTFITTIFISLIISLGVNATPEYVYQKLNEMITDVDSIVIAKVISTKKKYGGEIRKIKVKVVETLAGDIKSKKLKLIYFYPSLLDQDGNGYWIELPSSGLEISLEDNKEYVLLLKDEYNSSTKFELLRAEEIKQRDVVLEAWNKYRKKIKNKK
jgi:hypothetical protein